MDTRALLQPALVQLDEALWDLPGVDASDAESIRREALGVLPQEIAQTLSRLLETSKALESSSNPDPASISRLLFEFGHLHAEIQALHRVRAEIESAYIGNASVSPRPLDAGQPDQIIKFLALRDRLFRTVADFTLKLLLSLLGILLVLLLLGLI
jgi:hypothetical protein